MTTLSNKAQRILDWLVVNLPHITAGQPATYLNYGDGLHIVGVKRIQHIRDGVQLRQHGLEELAEWIRDKGFPAITGLIVEKTSQLPGDGYFSVYGRTEADLVWWEEEVTKSKTFNWLPYVSSDARSRVSVPPVASLQPLLPPTANTPLAFDLANPPLRIETSVYRILRDTALARRVKELHGYTCQLCGAEGIELHDGSKYAECHHVKPLGAPHNGPDELGNVLCVCPNCHVKLDYGVVEIELAELRTSREHQLATDYIRYHNTTIYRRER